MPEPAAPRAVLFDLDGTLIDTFHLYLEAYTRALTPFLGRVPTLDDFIARKPSSERHFLAEWLGAERAVACHAEVQRHYEVLHDALCEGPYEGVREMLAALRTAGYPLGIVTGKGRAAWEITEAAFDLGRFQVVITEDDVPHPKPEPSGLLAAAERLGIEPAQALYIGDSLADLEAGRRAGMQIGAALWPKMWEGEREQFLASIQPYRPEWTFERPADVTRALAGWC